MSTTKENLREKQSEVDRHMRGVDLARQSLIGAELTDFAGEFDANITDAIGHMEAVIRGLKSLRAK